MGNKTIDYEMDLQIVGKSWEIKPLIMKWIYTAMIRPIMTYACISWINGIRKKYLLKNLIKVQRLAFIMISSAFPGTPTSALEMLLNIMPIDEFILAETIRGSYRIQQVGLWPKRTLSLSGKTKGHVGICTEVRNTLHIQHMPSDRIFKTKVFERNFEC